MGSRSGTDCPLRRGYASAQMWAYVPLYRAEAIFSVSGNYAASLDILDYNYYYDNSAEEQLSALFPYVLKTDPMTERIKAKLGTETINGTISAEAMPDTNLFTLSVTGRNGQDVYDILCAVIEVYPQVSHLMAGNSQLSILIRIQGFASSQGTTAPPIPSLFSEAVPSGCL